MRPGRLDRILYVAPPDRAARLEIFDVNFRRMAVHEAVDREQLADMVRTFRRRPFIMNLSELSVRSPPGSACTALQTEGCSGAEIVSICQDAAFNAMNESLEAENVRHRRTPGGPARWKRADILACAWVRRTASTRADSDGAHCRGGQEH